MTTSQKNVAIVLQVSSPVSSYCRRGAEDLGELRVGVQAGEPVLAPGQRIEHRVVIEPLGELEVLLVRR